jgi:hypothetical protein
MLELTIPNSHISEIKDSSRQAIPKSCWISEIKSILYILKFKKYMPSELPLKAKILVVISSRYGQQRAAAHGKS